MHYKCHEINPNQSWSYIDSLDWIKNKKATIMLTHEEIQRDPQRITKIKTFINRYNWKEQNFKSREDDWKKNWARKFNSCS